MFRNIQRNSGKLLCICNVDDPTLSVMFLVQRRPNTANNDWNIARVNELIKIDSRVKLKEIFLKLDITKTNVYEIVHDNLGYRKVSARWSPKCCQMSISARESKSPKSCCTSDNKVMRLFMWGLAGTIVPGTILNTSSLEMKLGYT
ncbi:LOW QUALITY PROTEIN: histone-lysine N-methyltransferase SETMAR [Plakobranchus ocellatus]|uniref:Histone-lysine N-methyltransferase SETMAR n=1 Tax=Plakobranchus ocellatus TaxID=259542 RepID=A0AAV4C5W3_9GAST|nr:LOW QUALITY PROTEIN: histone-lysine N-methyltransferase SETMAR [Plakobranchus ocellatus]